MRTRSVRPEWSRATSSAAKALVKAEAVEVLSVGSKAGEPAHGVMPGAAIARHLERHGAKVEVRHMSSNGESVGRVLLAEARAFHADLVVIGAYGRSRLREHVFGGVTRTVLREAALPVLVSH